ncbi:hypothetical protein OIDMADRAFT_38748 [Oidiodendron maius Zn]|uniref:Phosphatidylinositol-specific phospholipase C X domain-containing protein n=1 Tax=Oidiodendron maius (strain Zn) TaxID=913774 RepID=A0A0C3DWI6_OIDMZ|nr:hypothetical protein OIDMADRAFT_38748 [Oidiodendron maius Zn]
MGQTVSAGGCNGNAALCSRSYSNVTQVGAHDSAFVGILPTDNQLESVSDQLDAGIRFLQGQTHQMNGDLYMCHTSCTELNAGLLTDYLTTIKTWMDSNPNEVVTLLLTNGDRVDVSLFGTAMTTTGLDQYAYTLPSQLAIDEWPTLQELIDQGSRLVMFLDYLADTSQVPYINDEFTYFFETAYDVTSFSSCALDRPPGSNGDGLMMIVNHFKDIDLFGIYIPDVADDASTNAATGSGSIGEQSDLCISTWGRSPNLILLDNFNIGEPFTAQDNLNHLS